MSIKSNLYSLIIKRRTVRLFKDKKVPLRIIKKIINAARCAPSAANLQFLEYLVITDENLKEKIFPHLRWAGYIYPKRVPSPCARPSFYIVVLINKTRTKKPDLRDVGAACQNILLALVSFNLGGCWIGALNKKALRKILKIPSIYKIDSIIACGYPKESPVLEEKDEVKYWLDEKNVLHVPKRPLEKIFHLNYL